MQPNHWTFHFFEQNRTNPAYILIESVHGMFSCHTIAEKVELHFSYYCTHTDLYEYHNFLERLTSF